MTPTKENVERLMEILSLEKCSAPSPCSLEFIKEDILIGDVLGKIAEVQKSMHTKTYLDFLFAWKECGFTRSLQEIVEESGWEEGWTGVAEFRADKKTGVVEKMYENKQPLKVVQLLKSPALELFQFLDSLFSKKAE